MNIDWETFQTAYKSIAQDKRDLIDSERVYECISSAFQKAGINVEIRPIMLAFTYHILDIQGAGAVIQEMEAFKIPQAHILFADILAAIQKSTSVQNQSAIEEEHVLESEIAETEKEFETIQGIRTMASDMHNVKNPTEVVHTSSQAELLNRTVPTASPEPSSRWETDR